MINIHNKTLQDLEFPTVLQQVSEHCITPLGNERALEIAPYRNKTELLNSLQLTYEYVSSFANDNRIPNHSFDTISKEIKLLNIENTFLEVHSLKKIAAISTTSNEIVLFLKKFEEYYPQLHEYASHIEVTKIIIDKINAIIDRFGDIKDNASDKLYDLRQSINKVKGQINSSFATALNTYHGL